MDEQPYGQEIVIQELLARYPDLLAGEQISPEEPRRWLLVTREMLVPDAEAGGGRWSLDHLFIDQDGIPTFVECKRAADTRSRREVVAQMLDYAANGVAYWSIEHVRQAATETAIRRGTTLDDEVRRLLDFESDGGEQDEGVDSPVENFWRRVEDKLKGGNVRLVFVAEETSRELRRLVEFLNEKLDGVEVLAIEVKQFLGQGQQVLVPRLVGMTEAARDKKPTLPLPRRRTSRQEFLAKCSDDARIVFVQIIEASLDRGYTVYWGEQGFSVRATGFNGRPFSFAYGYPGRVFNSSHDAYEAYTRNWPASPEEVQDLRGRLLALGAFSERGTYTLRAAVTKDDADLILKAHALLLDGTARLVSKLRAPIEE